MTLSRVAFGRALRRLDGTGARAFVADLLGARGYRTTVEGDVVTATGGPRGSMRLLVVADGRSLLVTGRTRPVDAVVVTGGPLASAMGSIAVHTARGGDRPDVHGPELLYEWFAFAVDSAARATLTDRYLGATEPSVLAPMWAVLVDEIGGTTVLPDRFPFGWRRVALVVLGALMILVAVTTIGPVGPLGSTLTAGDSGPTSAGEPTPEITSVPVTVTPVPATTSVAGSVPDICPRPPVDAHPAALRPGVRSISTARGLDGWRIVATQNVTQYDFDPNDQQARLVPEVRHTAVFETPADEQFRLGIDRWGSVARAETAVARGGPWQIGFAWGRYVVGVEWNPDGTAGDPSARLLLAAVTTPESTLLGDECISELLASSAANATA